jgi:hypothetical protein
MCSKIIYLDPPHLFKWDKLGENPDRLHKSTLKLF